MKIKTEWFTYIHNLRRRETDLIFSKSPAKAFEKGLELGAGDGFQSSLLSKYVYKLISTDFNFHRLRRKSTEAIDYLICDAEETDRLFKQGQFDLVFSSNLLEHLPDPVKALKAISEVLKDDGITIHVIPNIFWKISSFSLYIPNRCVLFLEKIMEKHKIDRLPAKTAISNNDKCDEYEEKIMDNNPKAQKKASRGLLSRILLPKPHGVSTSNIKEFYAFSKFRWKKEFKKAGLDLVLITKGPVSSGYGFGLNFVREILERCGLTSQYVYIAVKKDMKSSYMKYF